MNTYPYCWKTDSWVPQRAMKWNVRYMWDYSSQTLGNCGFWTSSLYFEFNGSCSFQRNFTLSFVYQLNLRWHPKSYHWIVSISIFTSRYCWGHSNFRNGEATSLECQYSSSRIKLEKRGNKKLNLNSFSAFNSIISIIQMYPSISPPVPCLNYLNSLNRTVYCVK